MSKELPILLRMCSQAEFRWIENGFYHGEGIRIPALEPIVGLLPVKKLSQKRGIAYHLSFLSSLTFSSAMIWFHLWQTPLPDVTRSNSGTRWNICCHSSLGSFAHCGSGLSPNCCSSSTSVMNDSGERKKRTNQVALITPILNF